MSLKNLLIVAYYFPPQGGAGTQRFAKFAKYLPDYGYRSIVLTADTDAVNSNAPHQDQTLMEEVGRETVIARVKTNPGVSLSVRKKISTALKFRIDFEEWVASAIPSAFKLIEEYRPVAVLTTVSPYAAIDLGRAVARRAGLPWLLDLRDPWALDGWREHPTLAHAIADKWVMRRAMRECDHVIANTPDSGLAYRELAQLPQHKVSVIPNGFDSDDFDDVPTQSATDDRFEMIHVGTLHAAEKPSGFSIKQCLRSRLRQVNGLGRTAYYLIHALARIKQSDPSLYANFRLSLVGSVHPANLDLARRLGVEDALKVEGYVSHRDALHMMAKSDAVFVPLHGLPQSDRSLVVPGKLYEALASERFIFACLPEGDASDLVRSTDAGVVCPPDDVAAIAQALSELIRQHQTGKRLGGAKRDALGMFTRRALTKDLASAVDRVCVTESVTQTPPDPWQRLASTKRLNPEAVI